MFYERLTYLCKENNTTLTTVLKDLGLSTAKGSQWKQGTSPSVRDLNMLAQYFNVSVDYLLGNDSIKKRPTPEDVELIEEARAMSPLFDEIAKLVLQLPSDKQKQAAEYVRFLLSQSGHADSNKED